MKFIGWLIPLSFLLFGCQNRSVETATQESATETPIIETETAEAVVVTEVVAATPTYEPIAGCDGRIYGNPSDSLYILPFMAGESYGTGLTNCSSSFHAPGTPDQYAFDFDMPVGTLFIAARAGTVVEVVEDAASQGGGAGNYVVVDHGDGTYAYYLHSPKRGIYVSVGDEVEQGQVLGETGQSGLAGYPHLHFIVAEGWPDYPYDGMPITFRNASPADVVLEGFSRYEAIFE